MQKMFKVSSLILLIFKCYFNRTVNTTLIIQHNNGSSTEMPRYHNQTGTDNNNDSSTVMPSNHNQTGTYDNNGSSTEMPKYRRQTGADGNNGSRTEMLRFHNQTGTVDNNGSSIEMPSYRKQTGTDGNNDSSKEMLMYRTQTGTDENNGSSKEILMYRNQTGTEDNNGSSTEISSNQSQTGTDNKLDPCKSGQECSTNVDKVLPNCYCDSQCREFNDCCHFNNTMSKKTFLDLVPWKPFLVCKQDLIQYDWTTGRGIYVVGSCPNSFENKRISNECESAEIWNLPVNDGYIVYANKYCAFCHGVKSFKIWTVTVQAMRKMCYAYIMNKLKSFIDFNMTSIDNLKENNCQVRYVPPPKSANFRTCKSNTQQYRKNDSCKTYFNPMKVMYTNYTFNIFYNYKCIGNQTNVKRYSCLRGVDYIDTFDKDKLIYPLTVIFNMNNDYSMEKQQKITDKDLSSTCPKIDMECDENKLNCFRHLTKIKNYQIQFSAVFLSNASRDEQLINRILSLYLSCLPVDAYALKIYRAHIMLQNINSASLHDGKPIARSMINTTWYALVTVPMFIPSVLDIQRNINQMEMSYTERGLSNTSDTVLVWKENDNVLGNNEEYVGTGTKVMFSLRIAKQTLLLFDKKADLSKPECVPKFCQIQSSVYTEKDKRTPTFTLDEHKLMYSQIQRETNIKMATLIYSSDVLELQATLTYVTLSISAFSVFITFCVFLKINLGKSTVGLITLNMLFVIFLFNICFMVGVSLNVFYTICYVVGVITHYLALLYFIWVTIFVIHAVYTINKTKQLRRRRLSNPKSKTFKIICLISYISPSCVVVPAVILDLFPWLPFQIGYGKGICFPAIFPGNLFVFTIPVGLCILINIICLLCAIISFWKLNNAIVSSNLKSSKRFVIIFLRVIFVSAVSWILGLFAGVTDNPIIGFCFIVLSGLHGFIICVCLLSTNVFSDAWKKFRDHIIDNGNNIEMFEIEPDINGDNVNGDNVQT